MLSVFQHCAFSSRMGAICNTPLCFFAFFCCVVSAPDVRYYLQLELDQPRQMLWPSRHRKNKCHLITKSTGGIFWQISVTCFDCSCIYIYVYTVCMHAFSEVYVCWYVVIRLNARPITRLQFKKNVPQWISIEPCILYNCANRTVASMISELHENKCSFTSQSRQPFIVINTGCMHIYSIMGNSSIICIRY